MERSFGTIVLDSGLPQPSFNVSLRVGGRIYVIDVLWPEHGVGAELLGLRFHSAPDAVARDARRFNAIQGRGGIRLLLFTWRDVTERPGEVVSAVRDALRV